MSRALTLRDTTERSEDREAIGRALYKARSGLR
jgi:hypothetical protein